MNDRLETAVQMVQPLLTARFPTPPIPVEAVDQAVSQLRPVPIFSNFSEADWITVSKIIKSRIKISMESGTTLAAPTVVDWLSDRQDDIDWKRWIAYRHLLGSKGFPPRVLATIEGATAEILNCLGDPQAEGRWKRRGLVIGDVQSGKTASYLGVVNRAADAGFKLIILLAGGTEALRKQTQFRVDEGLLGRDTAKAGQVFGVGAWHHNFVSAQALTTQESDFRTKSKQASDILVDPDSPTPLVFVLKKNKTALENLRTWISGQRLGDEPLDVPMLLLDDESDYASVNTRDEDSPTVINALIREILALATRSSYLAFTATPFANVFIDHETEDEVLGDDLFPKDYIRTLDAPTNYVGSQTYFGTEDAADGTHLIALDDVVDEFPFKHKSRHVVGSLPASLGEALRAYVVGAAARDARGDRSARSMLINVSRFKHVQSQVHELVEVEYERIKSAVELHSVGVLGGADEHVEIRELRRVFELYFPEVPESWPEVRPHLKAAVQATAVKLINSERVKKAKDLAEIETDRMIAVGGDVLSRGLTLDGLTVSYFYRQVGASDTLLQMARWFGYRPGYDDLCRVWIPDEIADQFRYVDGIVRELRGQLVVMKKQRLTPKDFGLRVRMHPESLLITARNKMKAAEAKAWTVNIAGAKNLETVRVSPDPADLESNVSAVRSLVSAITVLPTSADWSHGLGSIQAVADIDRDVVAGFLESYVGFGDDALFADSALANFVRTTKNPRFEKWTIGFVPGSGREFAVTDDLTVKRAKRAVASASPVVVGGKSVRALRVSGASSRLAGGNDVARAGCVGDGSMKEPDVYGMLDSPLLLVYLLEPHAKEPKAGGAEDKEAGQLIDRIHASGDLPIVAVKVAIPGTPGDKGADVKYMLNSVALSAWMGSTLEEAPDDFEEVDGADDA